MYSSYSMSDLSPEQFQTVKTKAHALYTKSREIYNPYFKERIILNADGFHHLQFSARHERSKREQHLKFNLLPLALDVISKSGTVQEYRKILTPIGKSRNGFVPMKPVEYWAFIAIVGDRNEIKIRTIVRRIGTGNRIFWSVMPDSKFKHGQHLAREGIEDV